MGFVSKCTIIYRPRLLILGLLVVHVYGFRYAVSFIAIDHSTQESILSSKRFGLRCRKYRRFNVVSVRQIVNGKTATYFDTQPAVYLRLDFVERFTIEEGDVNI